METVKLLLDLPFETLALLATGYLGYRIAFVGRDAHHAAVDVTFLSLVFAAISKIVTMALRLIPDFATLMKVWTRAGAAARRRFLDDLGVDLVAAMPRPEVAAE